MCVHVFVCMCVCESVRMCVGGAKGMCVSATKEERIMFYVLFVYKYTSTCKFIRKQYLHCHTVENTMI